MNALLLVLFVLAVMSRLTTYHLTSLDLKLSRASALISALGYSLAALFLLARLLGFHFLLVELLVTMAMAFTAVGAISHALGLILERHYHLKDLFNDHTHH